MKEKLTYMKLTKDEVEDIIRYLNTLDYHLSKQDKKDMMLKAYIDYLAAFIQLMNINA